MNARILYIEPIRNPPTNHPRDEILAKARVVLKRHGRDNCRVFFKYTCEGCGKRCIFAEPNVLPRVGICPACNHTTQITEAGFAITLGDSRLPVVLGGWTGKPWKPKS